MKRLFIALLVLAIALGGYFWINSQAQAPSHVELTKTEDGRYQMQVNGQPFIAKGVGHNDSLEDGIAKLKAAGGNSIRTWRADNAKEILEQAKQHDVMVAMGLNLRKQKGKFDYKDDAIIAAHLEELKAQVDAYKNHPNLLMWVVGNELNISTNTDGHIQRVQPIVYESLKELTDYIHEVDPHHPVTTTFAGFNLDDIDYALEYADNLDAISIQVYWDLQNVQTRLLEYGLDKPFFITEYGVKGHWEMPKTAWGREIEEPSGEKADSLKWRIEKGIQEDQTGQVLGHYAFLWGNKQERTPTWYGFFTPDGLKTSTVDLLTQFWTGEYPENRAPRVKGMLINGKKAEDSIYLNAGQEYVVDLDVTDPDGDNLTTRWELRYEVGARSLAGAHEEQADIVELKIQPESAIKANFVAPSTAGEYRLFAYISDGKGSAGTANTPVMVNEVE